jgi:RNA polymerase sigma-70 factor (ECF subfamily)
MISHGDGPVTVEDPGGQINEDPDAALVQEARRAAEGDLRAFEQLVRKYQRRVVANCRYITRDPNNSEDLAQEVLTKAFFGLRRFEGRSSFRQWLQQIKINHCLTHVKKNEKRAHVGIDPEDEDFEQLKVPPIAHRQVEAIDDREMITRILDSMSQTLRIPLILCDMDELSYDEVAKNLGISLSAAKMRIKRAREEFRARYENQQLQSA